MRFSPEKAAALPFCSERCRLIDLGRWLEEAQGLPVVEEEQSEPGSSGNVAGDSSPTSAP